jgi:hypothetical protein
LRGDVEANVPKEFSCTVLAGPDGVTMKDVWLTPPVVPTVEQLREIFKTKGIRVEVSKLYVAYGTQS